MGIHPSTLYDWQKKYPEISEALKKGKEVADFHVENALYKKALGYRYTEVTQEAIFNKKGDPLFDHEGNQLLTTTKKVTKEVPPDTGAIAFWLKNRQPEQWRDRPVLDDQQVLDKLDSMLASIDKAAKADE